MEKKFMGLSWSLGVLGLIMILVAKSKSVDAITCQEALISMLPCQPFLIGAAPAPVAPCCSAVANVVAAATTTSVRRELCHCFQKAAPALGVKPDQAKQLPKLCGVSVFVPIDPTVNCDNIK